MRRRDIAVHAGIATLVVTAIVLAGPLDPPPGPVAPSFKTLAEIEPRVPIGAATTPGDAGAVFRITQPGSYYLVAPVEGVAGKSGIEIACDDVTLDLAGMRVSGVADSLAGINTIPTAKNVRVHNGVVRGWGAFGVRLLGPGAVVSEIRASANHGGILVGDAALVRDCISQDNLGDGIQVGSVGEVRDCVARNNNGNGIEIAGYGSVRDCGSFDNAGNGFNAITTIAFTRCSAVQNLGHGIVVNSSASVENCMVLGNSHDGIVVTAQCRVVGNTVSTNGVIGPFGAGIHVLGPNNRIESNNLTNNDAGLQVDVAGSFIVGNSAADNSTNYAINGTQTIGPIIAATGTIVSTNAWANFSY